MSGGEKRRRNIWMEKKLKKDWKNNIKNKKSKLRNATTIFSQ